MDFQEDDSEILCASQKTFGLAIGCIALFFLVVCFQPLCAQNQKGEQGHYLVTNYNHEELPGHHQNWFITQDRNGFIYTGNGEGVLEFDGASWRLISSPGLNAVRTVVVDQDNIKWVGGDRELGYLKADAMGLLQFESLKDRIPESNPLTANIWQIFPDKDRILFVTDNTIYSWRDKKFTVIAHPGPGPIHREYQVHGKIYVSIAGEGMYEVIEDTLQLIPGGELFKSIRPTVALPYGLKSVLFASKSAGIFIYDGSAVTRLENEIEGYLEENLLYAGQRLSNSAYAFATLQGGVILMDENGKYIRTITENDGIGNNQVHGMTVDKQHSLWLALQTGISKVDPLAPYTFFDKRNGLEGTVSNIVRHAGRLYVATYSGLFVLENAAGIVPAKFRKIEEIKSGCFSLLQTGEHLFAATANGVFKISEKEVYQINNLLGCRTLCRSKRNANRIYVGHMHGLSSIKYVDGKWEAEKDIPRIKEDVFSIATQDDGTLWLRTSLQPVIKVEFPKVRDLDQDLDFDTLIINRFSKGLPEGPINMWLIEDELFVTTQGSGGPLFT
ncbi:MAG: hypothetical protein HKN31_12675, partial [Pricia sp.]|nr:hypothetical protein [Pricia sp.]